MAEELVVLFILQYKNLIRDSEAGDKTKLSPEHVLSAVSLNKGCHCVLGIG